MDLSNTAPVDWFEYEEKRDDVWNDVYSDWWWWYNETYFNRNNNFNSSSKAMLHKGKEMKVRVHINKLPAKNGYKNTVNVDSKTTLSVREQLQLQRHNMNKAQE
jgi:hypothetical protein